MLKPRLRQQQKRHWLFVSIVCVSVPIVLAAMVYAVITFGWDWTGFVGGYSKVTVKSATEDKEYLATKTLWDWMQLLLVPVMLAIGGFWLNQVQKAREERTATQRSEAERKAAEKRAQIERDIAADNQREAALQAYIDKIGELLLREQEPLGASPGNPQAETIARARTVTVLQILDPNRCASLLQFLSQARILRVCTGGDLSGLNLRKANLAQFDLSNFKIHHTDLSEANLSEAHLEGASLRDASLTRANLSGAHLSGAHLYTTGLSEANLSEAHLEGATLGWGVKLIGAQLKQAYLNKAHLNKADLQRANLSEADLSEAHFSEIDLDEADLRGAKGLTEKQQTDYQSRGALVDLAPSTLPPARVGQFIVKAAAVLNARPEDVYATIADYQQGHPNILPKERLYDLQVLEGGYGAGTQIRFKVKVLGGEKTVYQQVYEPEPGRVLVEQDTDSAYHARTTYTVTPGEQDQKAKVEISTMMDTSRGLEGLLERFLIRWVYRKELKLLEGVAQKRGTMQR